MILDEVAAVFEQEGDDAAEESERLPSLRMVRGSGSRQSHASGSPLCQGGHDALGSRGRSIGASGFGK